MINVNKYVGIPFKHNGRQPENGLDCWGLVFTIYGELGIEIPGGDGSGDPDPHWYKKDPERYLRFLQQIGTVVDPRHVQSLDIVYFALIDGTIISHAGVMLDECQFIHTLQRRNCRVNKLDRFWLKKIRGARRIPEAQNKLLLPT